MVFLKISFVFIITSLVFKTTHSGFYFLEKDEKSTKYPIELPVTNRIAGHTYEYDLIVIGGGSGGLSCAKQAADLKKKVAVLDYVAPSPRGTTWGLGGTCINAGCIPKKLMHHAALMGESINESRNYGWKIPTKTYSNDWKSLQKAVEEHVKSARWSTGIEIRQRGIKYINGAGKFKDPHTVVVKNPLDDEDIELTAQNILIATGGRPIYLDFPGCSKYCITSDDLFYMKVPPGKTLIIGSGYIGLECAGFLNGLGYDVTVIVRSSLLRGFDRDMVSYIQKEMEKKGVKFLFDTTVIEVVDRDEEKKRKTKKEKGIKMEKNDLNEVYNLTVTLKDNKTNELRNEEYNTLLVAVGRKPASRELNAEEIGLNIHPDSGKFVVRYEQTNIQNIYAVGDVAHGKPELSPVAIQAGKLLASRLYSNDIDQMDYDNIATTIFTPIEYGCIGLSEEEATEKYKDNIEVYHTFYKPTEYRIAEKGDENLYLKVITKIYEPQLVLGMHFVGPEAGEVIQGYAAAMKAGLTFQHLKDTVGIHPTISEEFTRVSITKRSGIDPKPKSCCS